MDDSARRLARLATAHMCSKFVVWLALTSSCSCRADTCEALAAGRTLEQLLETGLLGVFHTSTRDCTPRGDKRVRHVCKAAQLEVTI